MLVGYVRVSTSDQCPDLQFDALRQAGCQRFFSDVMSGARADRPGLRDLLDYVRQDDVAVCHRLDRLGRSLPDLLRIVQKLEHGASGSRA
jgi:DNA invertase Pin-like site-specific DNA recombinase